MNANETTDPDYKWWQGKVKCSICGHKQTSRIEIPKDAQEPIVALECAECHNMTCQVE